MDWHAGCEMHVSGHRMVEWVQRYACAEIWPVVVEKKNEEVYMLKCVKEEGVGVAS